MYILTASRYWFFHHNQAIQHPLLDEESFAVRFSDFWGYYLMSVPGLLVNHGELPACSRFRQRGRARSNQPGHQQRQAATNQSDQNGNTRADCYVSIPFGHGGRVAIGVVEYSKWSPQGANSNKWTTDTHKCHLMMRDMLCNIHKKVRGDTGVMKRLHVFGMVSNGEHSESRLGVQF